MPCCIGTEMQALHGNDAAALTAAISKTTKNRRAISIILALYRLSVLMLHCLGVARTMLSNLKAQEIVDSLNCLPVLA